MSSVNKVILIGRLGQDPEIRYTPSGDAVVNLSLATSEKWKDKNTGEQKEKTEWHKISFFGKSAEIINQYCKKGSMLYVEGSLTTRKWKDNDGNDRYSTEVKGRDFKFLDSGNSAPSKSAPANSTASQPVPQSNDNFDDDIPF